jgi:hypothetical protein
MLTRYVVYANLMLNNHITASLDRVCDLSGDRRLVSHGTDRIDDRKKLRFADTQTTEFGEP